MENVGQTEETVRPTMGAILILVALILGLAGGAMIADMVAIVRADCR